MNQEFHLDLEKARQEPGINVRRPKESARHAEAVLKRQRQ